MIGDITVADDIYIVCGYTDMRKSIDGLCAVIQHTFNMNPRSRSLYLFCGKRCDRLKALLYEADGFVLLYKRLDAEGRYRWPRNKSEVKAITWQQFDWLLTGLEIEQPKAIQLKNSTSQITQKFTTASEIEADNDSFFSCNKRPISTRKNAWNA